MSFCVKGDFAALSSENGKAVMKEKSKIVPIILGQDLGAYSVAKAFFDAFGVKSHAFGRYKCGISEFSRIIKIEFCSGYESIDTLLPELISFAKKKRNKELLLVPATDSYVEFVSENREELQKFYKFIIPDANLLRKLTDKAEFYTELQNFGIDFPDFFLLNEGDNYAKRLAKFSYPAVLKPAVSAEYWRHPFPGMKKVYFPKDKDEAGCAVACLRYYGYREGIILQKFIKDAEIYVYTAFFNEKSECDFGVFGKVVLEEIGETSTGNHSAIITEERCEITEKLDRMLSNLGYTGFANFDILKSDGKFYVLELNARQGRSCDYIRCAGVNIAESLAYNLGIINRPGKKHYNKIFWHYPSLKICFKYMNRKDRKEAKRLKKAKLAFSALNYRRDLLLNPRRLSYVIVHTKRMARRFKRDYLKGAYN